MAGKEKAVRAALDNTSVSQREFDGIIDLIFNGGEESIDSAHSPRLVDAIRRDYYEMGRQLDYGTVNRTRDRQNVFWNGDYTRKSGDW